MLQQAQAYLAMIAIAWLSKTAYLQIYILKQEELYTSNKPLLKSCYLLQHTLYIFTIIQYNQNVYRFKTI